MEANFFRRCLVACWTACAALGACGVSTYYVIDLSGGPNAPSYPMEILDGEPSGGWTEEHKTTKLVLRQIEAGTFMMCNQVSVTLTRPFFIGIFEVTSAQYAKVMGGSGNACPKAGISYNAIRGNSSTYAWPGSANVDSSTFIGKLREKTGLLTIDLPTEAQWEYACRAGTTTDFNNGTNLSPDEFGDDENLESLGWYFNNSYGAEAVGQRLPNGWGLYDMHGNVREWCLDRWNESLAGGNDPKGGTSSNWRVVRGGGYESSATNCIASFRDKNNPGQAALHDGFRIACFSAEILHAPTPYEGVYDGQGHGISVDVAMPTNAVISYALSENGPYQAEPILFTNATGNAETVWYKVEANGYDTVTSNSTVTITKATYDMTGVAWDYDEPFEGDGTEKTVSLLNLPTGLTVSYTGNAATAPGEYTAHASFGYDTVNYFEPVFADLTWTIERPISMGDFVNCPGLDFSTGGDADWYMVENESPDGFALRSGDITHSQTSRLEVVVSGPGTISFWCRVEGEEFRGVVYDGLAFCVDGERQGDGLINSNEWVQLSFGVSGEDSHTLSWLYVKDDYGDGDGADCAWLDAVTWTSASKQITMAMVGDVGNVTYTGSAFRPEPVVTDTELGVLLTNGVDYTLSYTNNISAGDATVTVTGKGNYSGVVTKHFDIGKAGNWWIREPSIRGWGSGQMPSTLDMGEAKFGSVAVTYGESGEIPPVNPGDYTATFMVAETSNYAGLVKMIPFTITSAEEEGPKHTLYVGEYFGMTLAELGYEVPTNGTPYSVKAYGLPAGLKLKYNPAQTKKKKVNGKVKTVVVKPAKTEWWIEGVPTAAMDFFTNPPYLVITTNGVAETHALPIEVLAQEATPLDDLSLGQSMNTNGWLAGVGAGWTVSGLPTGLKYATKKVTKKSGKKTVTVAEAYAVYGKTTKAGLFTITAKRKVNGFYETMKYRVLVRPAAVDTALFGDLPTNLVTMAYVPVTWDLAEGSEWDGGHAGRVTLPAVAAVGGKVAKVTGLPSGVAFASANVYSDKKKTKLKQAGQTIVGTPTKPGTYVVTFTKNVTTGTGKKKKTVAKTAQILWKVEPNDVEVELGFNVAGGVIESGVVGLNYGDLLAFGATEGAKVTASGLPAGIKLVKVGDGTYAFAGFTAKAGTYLVTVKATLNGKTVTQRLALKVEGLPDWAKGTFNGCVWGTGNGEQGTGNGEQGTGNGEQGTGNGDGLETGSDAQERVPPRGLATVTVSAAGKISGKFYEGGTNWTFSAACYTDGRARSPSGPQSQASGSQNGSDAGGSASRPYQFTCTNVVAKYAYKVKSGKKTVTRYVTRTFTLEVAEAGTRDACPYRGVATMAEVGVADVSSATEIEAWQNLWGSAYKAVGKKLFYTSKKKPYKTFDRTVEVNGKECTLTLKVTPTGAVTATLSYDTGKTKKDPKTKKTVKVTYKATCQSVVLPQVAADVEPFAGEVPLYFAPSAANGFDGVAGWVAVP